MFVCTTCEYGSPIKLGKCPNCGSFGTFIADPTKDSKKPSKHQVVSGKTLEVWSWSKGQIFSLDHPELSRVLHEGIRSGGLYLLGGEPGIGKSTILLQILKALQVTKVAYFSGEETASQIESRYQRIFQMETHFPIFHSTHLEDIMTTCDTHQYDLIVIDSIQTVYSTSVDSPAGSPNQVKYCAEKISEYCKNHHIACIIIGHVTKGGEIAWPKYLEHIVDVVLYLEGDRFGEYRFLRSTKNRFGSTDDTAIFEMTLFGLQPVYDLKERILHNVQVTVPGSVLTIGIDNGRPVMVQIEVLLNKTQGKFPQRSAIGVDNARLNLVIAICEKYLGQKLGMFDVYVNVPGEFKFTDSGLDLALAAAITSQYDNKLIDKHVVCLGELWLGGQVSKTKMHDKRCKELSADFQIIDYTTCKHIKQLSTLI